MIAGCQGGAKPCGRSLSLHRPRLPSNRHARTAASALACKHENGKCVKVLQARGGGRRGTSTRSHTDQLSCWF